MTGSTDNNLEIELTYSRFDRMSRTYPNRPALFYLGNPLLTRS